MSQALPPQPPQREPELAPSALIPILSGKVRLWRSKALIPIATVTVTALVLFQWGAPRDVKTIIGYMAVVSACLLVSMFVALYVYTGERKNMLWYAIPAAFSWVQLNYFFSQYAYVFRELLPGKIEGLDGFVATFVGMFFGAGLLEEVLKAAPILLAFGITMAVRRGTLPSNGVTRGLALQGPVDGVLMGAAAGAMFIYQETVYQYVFNQITEAKDIKMGVITGFMLLFPRIIKGVIGHIGYAGIAGYFIGLAATHPKHAWKLIPIGLVVASLLHAFWNSVSEISSDYGHYVAGPLIALVFLSCLMKARQLEASRTGGAIDGESILALSPSYGPGPMMPPGIVPPSPPGVAGVLAGAVSAAERVVGVTARTSPAPEVPGSGLAIGTSRARFALTANPSVDLSALFAADGAPPGCVAEVAAVAGGLALRNIGGSAWSAALPNGVSQTVQPGQYVAATSGTTLLLGSAVIGIGPY